jgi:hypothetical protein
VIGLADIFETHAEGGEEGQDASCCNEVKDSIYRRYLNTPGEPQGGHSEPRRRGTG